jgi:beta-lactamase class A
VARSAPRLALLGLSLLLGCAGAPRAREDARKEELERYLRTRSGSWGIYFRDLQTGLTVEVNSLAVFHAASTMKLLVLMKVFRDLEDRRYRLEDPVLVSDLFPGALGGEFRTEPEAKEVREALGKSLTVRELVEAMVVPSDNLATNLLIRKAGGPQAVTAHARLYGLQATCVARYIEDQAAFESGLQSRSQPRELGLLLERIWRGEVVSPEASRNMTSVMGRVGRSWLGLGLPPEARLAHKTGAIDHLRHDVGIVSLPGGRSFVLCVLGADLPDEKAGEETIARVAAIACSWVESASPDRAP